ncbi:MAG: hypothetical protein ACXWWC_07405 [Chitinophagaceae bacterium]
MKKIILAFDGRHFCEGSLQFARGLNYISPVLLTGVFLPQADYANLWSYSGGGMSGSSFIPLVEDEDAEVINNNIKQFESFCRNNEIQFKVQKSYFDFTIPSLKKESRFADLLVISSEIFYEQSGTVSPNDYLKELLHNVECPVIILPEKFEFPQRNIISYDGSESSVYAIRQFSYLLPELAKNKSIFVHGHENDDEPIPDEVNIRELVTLHYPHVDWSKSESVPKEYFSTWISEMKGSILISGAFGRSKMSMFFNKSFITDIISDHRLPVFICHK